MTINSQFLELGTTKSYQFSGDHVTNVGDTTIKIISSRSHYSTVTVETCDSVPNDSTLKLPQNVVIRLANSLLSPLASIPQPQ